MRIALLVAVGWALVATILAIGPDRIARWLGVPKEAETPVPPEAAAIAVYGPPVEVAALPGWAGDDVSEALPALLRSCDRLLAQPADRPLQPVELGGTPDDWRPLCGALRGLGDAAGEEEVRAIIEREAVAVPLSRADVEAAGGRPGEGSVWSRRIGLFTGYFEPLLHGSRRRSARYRVPLYMQPPDLVSVDLGRFRDDLRGRRVAGRVRERSLEPYDDRQAITSGSLAGRNLELVWVDDAIDAFFLHIQGSGRIELDDGSSFRVGYAAQNGHPYHAIGRTLVDRGELTLEEVSLQSIDAWLREHSDRAGEVMATNDSYVFFREIRGEGPVGAQGVALTPERSLAVDRQHVPLGVPVWLDAMIPAASVNAPDERRQWLLVAQDVGGAIRGAVRGDVFWGAGERARAIAGRMAHRGRYWALVPRGVALALNL
ncbi:MAG: murein transglycosylase A [Acidobacteriota bacterium]|nr:murein transglycosylase A [Acidobacteriota bacterium]MDE3265006.1 murein transglycosylase A [Acidobacteriota bacterium]